MTEEQLNQYREENTRDVPLPDGTLKAIFLPPDVWECVEFLRVVEGITAKEVSVFALEEAELQQTDFTRAFRCVVTHLVGRWY